MSPSRGCHPTSAIAALILVLVAAGPRAGATAVDQFALDPARTQISFSVDALGYSRTAGEFHSFDGRVAIDFDRPALSRVSFRVQAQSIDAGSALLSDYLRSDAFFNAARYAEITFVSTKVEKIDAQSLRVTGELTMLGVTRPLMVGVAVRRQGDQRRPYFEVTARATVNRLEFGMTTGYPLISRDVELIVASEVAGL